MLLATVLLLIVFVICCFTIAVSEYSDYSDWSESFEGVIAILSGITLVCFLIALPISRVNSDDFCEQTLTTQYVIDQARQNEDLTEFELMGLTNTVITTNTKIVKRQKQYTPWRGKAWLSPRVMKLPLLK